MIKKIVLFICGAFLTIMCLFALLGMYQYIYGLLHPNEKPTLLGYGVHIVIDEAIGDYEKGDLAIVKSANVYKTGDLVLYNYLGASMFDEIVNVNLDLYTMKKGYTIDSQDIVGKATYKISNFEGVYNFMTSPIMLIVIVISTIAYYIFVLGNKSEK